MADHIPEGSLPALGGYRSPFSSHCIWILVRFLLESSYHVNFFKLTLRRSHYYKKERPFMTMLSQLAISMACELGIQNDAPKELSRPSKPNRFVSQIPLRSYVRTLE